MDRLHASRADDEVRRQLRWIGEPRFVRRDQRPPCRQPPAASGLKLAQGTGVTETISRGGERLFRGAILCDSDYANFRPVQSGRCETAELAMSRKFLGALAMVVCAARASAAAGQVAGGSISGIVTDQQGGALSGVAITVQAPTTVTVTTGRDGTYRLSNIVPR